jgi:hypothetical protein
VFGFLLLMLAVAGPASAASTDSLTADPSVQTSVDTDPVSADATVSGDGATVSADSPVGSADATVSGDGATVSADSPVGSADATVRGDGATVSADSPVGSADVTLSGGDTSAPNTYLQDPDATSRLPIGPAPASLAGPLSNNLLASVRTTFSTSLSTWVTADLEAAHAENTRPSGSSGDPFDPNSPDSSLGLAPAPTTYSGHGAQAILAWVGLIALSGLLWHLLTTRSRVPRGNSKILALPG